MKKVLLSILAVVTVAALAITGTIAYLQSEDEDVNVMTLGKVAIAQHEYERVVDANGSYTTIDIDGVKSYELQKFTQAKPLLPATETDANGQPYNYGAGDYDSTRVKMVQVDSHGSMDVFVNKNAQDKFVTVENTGKSDAYVRTVIAMEIGSLSVSRFDEVIGTSSFMTEQGVWEVTDIGPVVIDGNNYFVVEYLYNGAKSLGGVHENGVLPAGDTTYPSLAQVYMTAAATNEDCENIDGNKNGTYDILVVSQAVQVAGFDDATTALDTAFGDVTTTNHPWAGEGNAPVVPVVVSDAAELNAVIAAGGSAVLSEDVEMEAATTAPYGNKYGVALNGGVLDGNGNELEIECYGDDYGIMTTGGTVKNLTIKEGCRAVMIMYATEDIILDNVNIGGDGVLYPINTGETGPNGSAGIDLIVTNSTIKGWTSYGDAIESASFTNVSFGQGTYYNNIYGRVLKPYVNTTLTDCSFIEHMNLDLSALKEGHKVTIENCTVNGQAVTADVFTIPSTDAEYDTELFTVDLPSWATSISDCIIFK